MQIFQAASVAVLSAVFPLMLPFLIVPWTRGLFWGYLRWLATVLLWGATFRILDAVTLTIYARSLVDPMLDAINGPVWALAQIIPNYFAAGLIVHFALFALQLTAPGLAYALVHGVAQRSSH